MTNAELLAALAARIEAAGTTVWIPTDEFRQLQMLIGYLGFDYRWGDDSVAMYLSEARRMLDMARIEVARQVKTRITL
jgi:hypothetical protein